MKVRFARGLILVAIFMIAVFLVFPLTFGPAISDPESRFPANPFYLEVRVANENMTPLNDFHYSCEVVNIELKDGVKPKDARVLNQGQILKFTGRRGTTLHCETAYIIDVPIKSAEFKLTFSYKPFPWRMTRTIEYHFAAEVDAQGHVTKWVRR